MQLVVDRSEFQKTLLIVTGKTSIGTVKGVWNNKQEPIVGTAYHVELSIGNLEEVKIFCENIVPTVYLEHENVVFTGFCEDRDDEVCYLRLAVDWLEMLDINTVAPCKKGNCISFSVNWHNIEIYPYDFN